MKCSRIAAYKRFIIVWVKGFNGVIMKIAIANDHVAVDLKKHIKEYIEKKGYETVDFGTNSTERTDYPIYGKKAADAVANGECDLGIIICGTGIGISIAANKVKGIRAACCSEPFSARLTREHNNANVLCFGARVIGEGTAMDLVDAFVDTPFSFEERHENRIAKITALENNG